MINAINLHLHVMFTPYLLYMYFYNLPICCKLLKLRSLVKLKYVSSLNASEL